MGQYDERLNFACKVAKEAGKLGRHYFAHSEKLTVTSKGHQDMVSEADQNLETLLRSSIGKAFPEDGIVGEEHGVTNGTSGFTWVLDPIDGTANFVRGIPAWCVVIACVTLDEIVVGVIHDPNSNEIFAASLDGGATLNGRPILVSANRSISEGSIGVGLSNRVAWQPTVRLISALQSEGGLFFRNASGALMLAYVAAGRLMGYCEEHMNAWDCVAGLLLVREAGGRTNEVEMQQMLRDGGLVVAGGSAIYAKLAALAKEAFKPAEEPVPASQK